MTKDSSLLNSVAETDTAQEETLRLWLSLADTASLSHTTVVEFDDLGYVNTLQ